MLGVFRVCTSANRNAGYSRPFSYYHQCNKEDARHIQLSAWSWIYPALPPHKSKNKLERWKAGSLVSFACLHKCQAKTWIFSYLFCITTNATRKTPNISSFPPGAGYIHRCPHKSGKKLESWKAGYLDVFVFVQVPSEKLDILVPFRRQQR